MRRFDYEDDDFRDEDLPDINGDEDDELSIEYLQILGRRELIEEIKLQLAQKKLNYSVLNKSVKYLEKSWFWRFKSLRAKLNLIIETYQTFKILIDTDVSKYQEEEQNDVE